MLKIDFNDDPMQATLKRLIETLGDARPAMVEIGEELIELSKSSFEKSASPMGEAWVPNSPVTIVAYLDKIKGAYTKSGKLSKKGADRVISKKPLIGHTRDLSRQFSYSADASSVIVRNTMKYAAMQQFGGKKSEFGNLWGDIPARPFMPIDANGTPDAAAQKIVNDIISSYLDDAVKP
jgi:phage gpG-like protein